MTKLQKILLVIVSIVVLGGVFLFSTGYASFELPLSFGFGPHVAISKSKDSPKGFFGSSHYEPLVSYKVKVKGLKEDPARLQKIPIKVLFNPKASQDNNGLRNFYLTYNYCLPKPVTYGYKDFYGSVKKGCVTRSIRPSSVQQSARETTLVFTPNWNFYRKASRSTITLYGIMAYTQSPKPKSPQKVRAKIAKAEKKNIIFRDWRGKKLSVNLGRINGKWLKIRPGYGYPLILK